MSVSISRSDLLRDACLINGNWCAAESGETLAVSNPANGEVIGTVPKLAAAEPDAGALPLLAQSEAISYKIHTHTHKLYRMNE